MYSTYFPFTFFFPFFFSFQIYHSPIHKQAESKSLTITPVTENICIQSFAFYLPVVFFPPDSGTERDRIQVCAKVHQLHRNKR